MIKVLSCRFQKCLAPIHTMTAETGSETALFREWSNQVFDSLQFWKYISYDDHVFFSKCLKSDEDSINGRENSAKVFRF